MYVYDLTADADAHSQLVSIYEDADLHREMADINDDLDYRRLAELERAKVRELSVK
jgi:hypothetical protein